ncbi:MAG: hypothetical protein EBR82_30965 [Caulobacteraceae bacterium]|nr:hypothetical protein [Caulobacteraceae bacterium]
MEKYGFVYIWMDRKHKRFYIGCHWGTQDDGYICSSNWMRRSYKRRPNDFKRRILEKVVSRDQLLIAEGKWLYLIPNEELGKKYYNLTNHVNGHWTSDNEKQISIKEKISNTKKKFWSSPESEAAREKIRQLNKEKGIKPPSRKGVPGWNKGLTKDTDQRIKNNSIAISKPKSNTKLMGRYNKFRDSLKQMTEGEING